MFDKATIPIFDCLTHPTVNGQWSLSTHCKSANIDVLINQMYEANIKSAFAVGMKDVGGYNDDDFIKLIEAKGGKKLFPIAFFDFRYNCELSVINHKLKLLKDQGFYGIKLHSRIGNFLLNDPLLPFIIDKANEYGLIVLLCTYFYSNKQSPSINNVNKLGDLLLRISSESRLILLHGGGVRLLEMMEIVRAFPNTLMDLSFTICKYEGSSLDLDIEFMFKNFDKRICVGSDHPDMTQFQLRERFDFFSQNITIEKAENIAFRNIENFFYKFLNNGIK